VYYYDYENRQYTEVWNGVPQGQLCPSGVAPTADPRLPGALGICFTDRNLGKVETYGGELSTKWLPTDNDSIDFSLSYLSATVAESQKVLVDPSGSFMDVNGQTMPDAPKWTINAGYEHRFDFKPGSLFLRADGRYTSESYFEGFGYLSSRMVKERLFGTGFSYSARDIYTCKAHYVYDFTATYLMGGGKYTISAYVKNITEEYWKLFTGDNDVSISAPRTYGVTFTARF
jgi:iron complex outermembrane receptor protein